MPRQPVPSHVVSRMLKADFKKEMNALYKAPKDHPVVVDVPQETFLMIDGEGSPSSSRFQEAIEALYAVAHALHAQIAAKNPDHDYVVMPLEALWWWGGEAPRFPESEEHVWRWTLMIAQPVPATSAMLREAMDTALEHHPQNTTVRNVRMQPYREGRAMQILHQGPYKDEWPTLQTLHDGMRKAGYVAAGKHHEIYLGDPRRAKPQNLRTILRQPVKWTDEGQE